MKSSKKKIKDKPSYESEENLDFLVVKSKYQLDQTISGFNEAKKTSHIHLGITTFLFTVQIGVIYEFKEEWFALLFLLPIVLTLISFYRIVSTLYAVRIINGKSLEYYESCLDKDLSFLKRTEIADVLRTNTDYKEKTELKNKIIKWVGEVNLISLILVLLLLMLKISINLHMP
jgi:hypothetical protein